ncbi:MAG: cobyric acid synthase [Gemmataceae bacterium]
MTEAMPRALMIQGTASHVGKSVLSAALGRWVREQGPRVAPFKAQNMSLNSYVTLHGEEIARGQATQAEALGLEPTADMNPILLKPLEHGCQVIVQGHGIGIMSIHEYYAYKPQAWRAVTESYDRLARLFDVIVLEGAGSPAEINLKEQDLVNMRMAEYADAAVVLVADIERGGVFAQLVGTWELLEPRERQRIVGFLINKFRGDVTLLDAGLRYLHDRTAKPVLGVLPYDVGVRLDEEDSLGVAADRGSGALDIVIVRLPGLSNFTDFAALARAPGVAVRYVQAPEQMLRPDLIILPGTRTTLSARYWLRATGLDQVLINLADEHGGPLILGLCGGYQLLGHAIADPLGVESTLPELPGLGLLDIDTRFEPGKTLHRVEGEVLPADTSMSGCRVVGYEIHQGVSRRRAGVRPWLRLRRQPGGEVIEDGVLSPNGRIRGTYLHGLFDDARFCRALIAELRRRRGLPPLGEEEWLSQRDFWARRYAHLPDWLEAHCDLRPIKAALGLS